MNRVSPSQSIRPWLRANLGHRGLDGLTGTDGKALSAAVEILELYRFDGHESAIEAFGKVVLRLQPRSRELAYHAIAFGMHWSDRPKSWAAAGLPGFIPSRCANE